MSDANKIVMEYRPPWHVILTYFEESGKYYSEGAYMSDKLAMYEIFEEAKQMLAAGNRPGLVDGKNAFYAVVRVPDHPHDCPALFTPEFHYVKATRKLVPWRVCNE